jgi:hypothetical protein
MKSFYCPILFYFITLFFIIGKENMIASNINLEEFLPESVDVWQSEGEGRYYDRQTLYEYINGGAELYLSYGFFCSINKIYQQSGQPDIIVDIFDMGSSENAFGVFSHSRETNDKQFGQGSQYTSGLLLYWKDRFYISILASPETAESKRAVFQLASQIEKVIPHKGSIPEIVDQLPPEGLIQESIKYFKHHIWLNSYYFISDENILHITEKTEAVMAKYQKNDNKTILLLVRYPDQEKAVLAYDNFLRNFVPEMKEGLTYQIEDGSWVACKLDGSLIKVVFNASEEQNALELLGTIKQKNK